MSKIDVFYSHAERAENGCLLWTAYCGKDGYGNFHDGSGRTVLAHRWIYKQLVGLVDESHVVMHTCDTPSCVELSHLKEGTVAENNRDRRAKNRCYFQKMEIFACGHPRSPENMAPKTRSPQTFICRICKNDRKRTWRAKKERSLAISA